MLVKTDPLQIWMAERVRALVSGSLALKLEMPSIFVAFFLPTFKLSG
jgi:hypothetical protein